MQDSEENDRPRSAYENILKNTLMKRTGRQFQRNVERAQVPKNPEKLAHEDVANQIFDNILNRKQEEATKKKADESANARPTEISKTYSEILDDILWPDENSDDLQPTLNTTPDQPTLQSQPTLAAAPKPTPPPAYEQLLSNTLNQRVKQIESAMQQQMSAARQAQPLDYAQELNKVLGIEGPTPGFKPEKCSLTQTLYNRQLDDILWPTQLDQNDPLPPVNEDKVRSLNAQYLQDLIAPEAYGIISVQRQVMDEKFGRFWIQKTMADLQDQLYILDTEFAVWVFLNHLDLIKPLLSADFVERFRLILEQMLPQKKADQMFVRTLQNKEQRLVFDRMVNGKFEDLRRILKARPEKLSDEDSFHIFSFLKIKLPEFLNQHQQALMLLLQTQDEQAIANPYVASFLACLFFSDSLQKQLTDLREDQALYDKSYRQFLRQRAESVGSKEDGFVPLLISAMDLFHEKAHFFSRSESECLQTSLQTLDTLLFYVPESNLEQESLMENITHLFSDRSQSQFHIEAQALESLGQEIGILSRQSDQGSRIRINHLNKIYERHQQEISEIYHKRRDTLNKLINLDASPGKRTRKQFIQQKTRACQQYIQRHQRPKKQALQIPYRNYPPELLEKKQRDLLESMTWENSFEEEIARRSLKKADLILNALNESKSTVQFNLKLLFDGEPQQDVFLSAFRNFQEVFKSLQGQLSPEIHDYLSGILDPYFIGLNFKKCLDQELELSLPEQIGYITAYLGHHSHIKLLINQQYKQVIYDFRTLFELTHALLLMIRYSQQPHADFTQHFQNTLFVAWDNLISHCLMIGSGQYHFVANPLALHDYEWVAPLTGFGVASRAEDPDELGFEPLSMDVDESFNLISIDDADETPETPTFQFRRPSEAENGPTLPVHHQEPDDPDDFGHKPRRKKFGLDPSPADTPAISPAAAGPKADELSPKPRRFLPSAPGKYELYAAPQRASLVVPPDDDDFYNIIGQTVNTPPNPTASNPPPPSAPPTEPAQFMRPRSAADDVSLASEDDLKNKRKRWLEITPVPEDEKNYDQMLDSILDSWGPADDPPPPDNPETYQAVEDILKRNRLDADMDVSGDTAIMPSRRRKKPRF